MLLSDLVGGQHRQRCQRWRARVESHTNSESDAAGFGLRSSLPVFPASIMFSSPRMELIGTAKVGWRVKFMALLFHHHAAEHSVGEPEHSVPPPAARLREHIFREVGPDLDTVGVLLDPIVAVPPVSTKGGGAEINSAPLEKSVPSEKSAPLDKTLLKKESGEGAKGAPTGGEL